MRVTDTSAKIVAARDEILRVLPPSRIHDKNFQIDVWHIRSPAASGHMEIVKLARQGDVDARKAISTLLSNYASQQVDPPIELYLYVHDKGTDELSKSRGKPRLRNWARDFWISLAMSMCEQRGLKPTRTALKRTGNIESASQLVESILKQAGIKNVGVSQIEKIYGRGAQRVRK